jgi:hypothetical protein
MIGLPTITVSVRSGRRSTLAWSIVTATGSDEDTGSIEDAGAINASDRMRVATARIAGAPFARLPT